MKILLSVSVSGLFLLVVWVMKMQERDSEILGARDGLQRGQAQGARVVRGYPQEMVFLHTGICHVPPKRHQKCFEILSSGSGDLFK